MTTQTSNSQEIEAINRAFKQLLYDLSWATASQLPEGEALRERCAKAEQEISRSWNEQLYGSKPSATGLADLVADMRFLRGLRVEMEDPALPVPQLSAPAALNRAKRLIAAGAADEALHLLAAAKNILDDATLGQLIPPLAPTPEGSMPAPAIPFSPVEQRPGPATPLASAPSSSGRGAGNQSGQSSSKGGNRGLFKGATSLLWWGLGGGIVFLLVCLGGILLVFRPLNPPLVTPTPTRVVTVSSTKTPRPSITPTVTVMATTTPTLTVTLSPTGTVETANPTPTGTVSGTTAPTSITLQPEPTTLPLHLLSTTTFTVIISGAMPLTDTWQAIIVNKDTPIVTTRFTLTQPVGQGSQPASLKLTLTAGDLTKLRQQFTGATTPELRLTFTTGGSLYKLPDVALTVEPRTAKGLPVVVTEGDGGVVFPQGYTEVTTFLLNKGDQVYTGTQGFTFVPLFTAQDLKTVTTRTNGTDAFPYKYPLVGNGDTVALLDEATTTTSIKVYLVRIVKVADPARAYGEGQTGWLPAVFIDGLRQAEQ